MLQSFLLLLPMMALIGASFFIGRMVKKPSRELSSHYILFDHFVQYIAAPMFFLASLASVNPDTIIDLPYFFALMASQFIMAGIALVITGNFFDEPFGERLIHSLSASIPNSLYFGLPILILIFGDHALLPALQAVFIQIFVMRPIIVIALEFDLAVRRGFSHGTGRLLIQKIGQVFFSIFKQPLLWAVIGGYTLAVMGWKMPKYMDDFVTMMGSGLSGFCLFTLGVFMGQTSFSYKWQDIQESCWVVILKMIFMPLFAWVMVTLVFPYLESVRAASVVVTAALPTASMVMILAHQFGIRRKRTMLEFNLTALASAVTLVIILAYYLE